jgi:primosomal protein N' (replication factor Y) (superfamily II helicase)
MPVSEPARVVRVLPDEPAIGKQFDYSVPEALHDEVRVGSMVRVALHGRRIGGWVVADDVESPAGITLRPIAKVTGWGPPADILDLAEWAAWRWAGRPASMLRTASPERAVRRLPSTDRPITPVPAVVDDLIVDAFAGGGSVLRLPPAADPYDVALAAAGRGNALILVPTVAGARHLGIRLRRAGVRVAIQPSEWAQARAGATVVGTRSAVWAPVVDLAAVVVIDEHDESWQQEQAPTWHARDVAVERARRADVPCVLVSPTPSLEALGHGRLLTPSRSTERAGWPVLDVIDRRREDPGRAGLFSERFVRALRGDGRVVCVLNRAGRSRLLACKSCGELARCERNDAAVTQDDEGTFACAHCGLTRPAICLACGSTTFKNLRVGVSRAREELEALAREPVVEVTAKTSVDGLAPARVYIGTEAVLHHLDSASVVAFLDFDQELLAPRYRAAEEALALLVLAGRLVGGRQSGGRLVVQTRIPDHEVVQAALHADPSRVSEAEHIRRQALAFPPEAALAVVSGVSAQAFIEAFGRPLGVEIVGPSDGRWLLRARTHTPLLDALAATPRPAGRLRIAVDPLRL